MIFSKYRLFKLSVLVTPYDKHLNPELYNYLTDHSETITCSKYASKIIVSEEWQNFYAHTDCEIYAFINAREIKILMIIQKKEVTILSLLLSTVPNIRCQTKDKTMQLKYYIEWEKKYQLNFYAESEMKSFKMTLDSILSNLYGNMRMFVKQMDNLSGDISRMSLDSEEMNTTSYESSKDKFKNLVNKENKD